MEDIARKSQKRYTAALKRGSVKPPDDWQERIGRVPGVLVVGRAEKRMQFEADPETVRILMAELGPGIVIEEIAERNPQSGT